MHFAAYHVPDLHVHQCWDQPWIYDIPSNKQALYQPITDCNYCPVFGSFKNWNIIHLSPKSTPFEAFEEIHQVFLDEISDNTASLFQSGNYGTLITADTTKNGFYVIIFIS